MMYCGVYGSIARLGCYSCKYGVLIFVYRDLVVHNDSMEIVVFRLQISAYFGKP
jgi:hypothetical protein